VSDPNIDQVSDAELWAALDSALGQERADLLVELGSRAANSHDYQSAASLLEQAHAEYSAAAFSLGAASVASDLGGVLHTLGRYDDAAEAHGRSASGYADLGDALRASVQLVQQADSLLAGQRHDDALESAESSLALAIGESDEMMAGEACFMKARALYWLDRDEEALEHCGQAHEHFSRRRPFPTERVMNLDDFALSVALYLGRLDDALQHARNAYVLAKSSSSQRGLAYATQRLAYTHLRRDEHRDASQLAAAVADEYRAQDDLRGLALCLKIRADALFELRDHDDLCREIYGDARVLFDNLGMPREAFECGSNISVLLFEAGRSAEGVANEQSVLDLAIRRDEVSWPDARWSAARLAIFLLDNGQPADALATCERMEYLWEQADREDLSRRRVLATKARALHALERHQEAAALATEVLASTPVGKYNFETAYMSEYRAESLLLMQHEDAPYYLAQAVALHLAHGNADRARDLSQYFIDEDKPLMRANRGFDESAKGAGTGSRHDLV
jgi:tetratricopeptide (TPR) repeat protein